MGKHPDPPKRSPLVTARFRDAHPRSITNNDAANHLSGSPKRVNTGPTRVPLTHRAISIFLALAIAIAPAAVAAAPSTRVPHTAYASVSNAHDTCPCAQQEQQAEQPTLGSTNTPSLSPCPLCVPSQASAASQSSVAQTPCKGEPDRWCDCGNDCRCAEAAPTTPPTPINDPATPSSPRTNIQHAFPANLVATIIVPSPAQVTRSATTTADSAHSFPPLGLNTRPQAIACRWLT